MNEQEAAEKRIRVAYGDGSWWGIPESGLPKALEVAEYMRQIALRPGSGYTEEEANEMYTLRILKDGEFVPIKQPE